MRTRALLGAALALTATTATAGCGVFGSDEPADIQVYSARHYDLEESFVEFEEQTGLSVEFIYGDDAELLERIKAEGEDSPADVFMTVDAGNLWDAAQQDVLVPVNSRILERSVPADYQDPQNRWFGLALRARTILYNPDAVDPAEFDTQETYAGLTDPQWQGRLCMRDSTEAYTQSLVASLIDLHGRERTLQIVEGWLANDVDIMSNDVELIEAVDSGACEVAIVNHYYVARELADNPDLNVKLAWASQDGAGTHVNLSGAGVVKGSDDPGKARQLIEWIAEDGQSSFVDGNYEYPVNPAVEPTPLIAKFGEFKAMPPDAAAYGNLNAEAVDLLAQAGYE